MKELLFAPCGPHSEGELNHLIHDYLVGCEEVGLLMFERRNTGKVGGVRFGKKGFPDWTVYLPGGRTVHLEAKRPDGKGKLSDDQKDVQRGMERLGHEYHVVESMRQVCGVLGW